MNIPGKKIELFCGTGGVGKTTLASSRAIHLASQGRKVLLITIDPAKRLKEVLNLDEQNAGKIQNVNVTLEGSSFALDALLMNPFSTFYRIAEENGQSEGLEKSHIIQILTRPYGGMNEIMALIEVNKQLKDGAYDSIILDTPPGKHFVDFLKACHKVNQFFDKTYVEIFQYLGKKFANTTNETLSGPRGLVTRIMASGIKKLLSILEIVTGKEFVEDFIHALFVIYQCKGSFVEALGLEADLKRTEFSNWFLVTSTEHNKYQEAMELQENASKFMHQDSFMLINKCNEPLWQKWMDQTKDSPRDDKILQIRETVKKKEDKIKKIATTSFSKIIEFPEIFSDSAESHVKQLMKSWNESH